MLDTQDWRGEHLIRSPRRETTPKERKPMSPNQAAIHALIAANPSIRPSTLKSMVSLNWSQVGSLLISLRQKGYVTKSTAKNSPMWVIP